MLDVMVRILGTVVSVLKKLLEHITFQYLLNHAIQAIHSSSQCKAMGLDPGCNGNSTAFIFCLREGNVGNGAGFRLR